MKLVKLSRPDGSDVWVNPAAISTVAKAEKPGHTHLTLAGAMQVVQGDPDDIVEKISGHRS